MPLSLSRPCLVSWLSQLACACALAMSTASASPTEVASPHAESVATSAVRSATDARWQAWSTDFLAGRREAVARAVAADLASAHPHPSGPRVWLAVQRSLGRTPAQAVQDAPPAARPTVAALVQLQALVAEHRADELLAQFPADHLPEGFDAVAFRDLARGATKAGRPELAFTYWLESWKRFPDEFATLEALRAFVDDGQELADLRARVQEAVAPAAAQGRLSAIWTQRVAREREWVALDALTLARRFGDDDAAALRFAGTQADNLARWSDGLAWQQRAERLDPFVDGAVPVAVDLMHLRRFDEARAALHAQALRLAAGGDAAALREARDEVEALRRAGELGLQRERLAVALKRWPDDAVLHGALAWLEEISHRPADAAEHWRAVVRITPKDAEAWSGLVRTLGDAGERRDALDASDEAAASGVAGNDLFSETLTVRLAQGQAAEALRAAEAEIVRRPLSNVAWSDRAEALLKLGRHAEAVQALEGAFRIRPSRWKVDHYVTAAEGRDHDHAAADRALASLQDRYPASSDLADVLEERAKAGGPPGSTAVAAADAAAKRAPASYWPHRDRAWYLMEAGQYDAMVEAVDQGLQSIPEDMPGRRAALLTTRADMARRLAPQGQRQTPARLQAALDDLQRAEALGGYRVAIHQHRWEIHQRLGHGAEALANLKAWADEAPDDTVPADNMARIEDVDTEGWQFVLLHRLVERNPYDGARLELAANLHALWGGSPLLADRYARLLRRNLPDYPDLAAVERRVKRGMNGAFGLRPDIGDSGAMVSPSDRYVGWFDDERRQAQGDANFLMPEKLDLDHLRATVLTSDGVESERGYHPVSGKPNYVRVGKAWMSATYDADGLELQSISDMTGVRLKLTYDDAHRIQSMQGPDGHVVTFGYGAGPHPTHIEVPGKGSIEVRWSESGEVEKVDSAQGSQAALAIIQTFQSVQAYVAAFAKAGGREVPDLPFADPALEALRTRAAGGALAARWEEARYLVQHVGDRPSYAGQARHLLDAVIEQATRSRVPAEQALAVDAVVQWHRLALEVHPHGVATADWMAWRALQQALDGLGDASAALAPRVAAARGGFAASPLQLLPTARWLPRSYVDNPGFWRHAPPAGVGMDTAQGRGLLVRRQGDLVVGTATGLSVFRRGFWEPMGFDADQRRFSENTSGDARLLVHALAEDAAGRLWVGTDNGVLMLPGAYDGAVKRWAARSTGLPAAKVTALVAWDQGVLVGTAEGLRYLTEEGVRPLPAALEPLSAASITMLRATTGDDAAHVALLVGTPQRLQGLQPRGLQELAPQAVSDAIVHGDQLFLLRNDEVTTRRRLPDGRWSAPARVVDAVNIVHSKALLGFGLVPVEDDEEAVAVLTDMGLALFRDEHFEFKKLPGSDRDVVVRALQSAAGRTLMLTDDGVFTLEPARVQVDTAGRVHDLLTVPALHATLVARGDHLEAVSHAHPERGPQRFSDASASVLALQADGGVLASDDLDIVRFAPGSDEYTTLFHVPVPANRSVSAIGSLLVASDGVIWATAGPTLVRYADGRAQSFSILDDSDAFPAGSDMISRVIETADHRIWVVASNEGHRYFRGEAMKGGLLEWTGSRFVRKDTTGQPWFFTSATVVGEGQTVLGTNAGFAMQDHDQLGWLASMGDPSYLALRKRQPMLALGTRGAPLGTGTWLFGTPGGLVAWHEGRWILPDRLNWLLPAPELANYGGRMVHAVATDEDGRIYAGTDRGLMIYKASSPDNIAEFLVASDLPDVAFAASEHRKLRSEAAAFMRGVPPDSAVGRLVDEHARSARALATLQEQHRAPNAMLASASPAAASAGDHGPAVAPPPDLDARLQRQEKAHKELLARLEKDAYGLYQMLELKPIELAALRERLPEDAVVVQYLPTKTKLLIHVASRHRTEVREVDVTSDELMLRSAAVAEALAIRARNIAAGDHGGHGDRGIQAMRRSPTLAAQALVTRGPQAIRDELHWLYEQLLRPVERDVGSFAHVYVSPVGALMHVPFGALVRSDPDATPEFAAQRLRIGVLPSLYLLDLVLHDPHEKGGNTTIFGNPDGTLAGAESEARQIGGITGPATVVTLGRDATLASLERQAAGARWLHLATHGVLDSADPTRSYLVLAQGQRLSMVDAMQLPLQRTETVVLSACETGTGADGLEYATLSRAFAYAGAPSVVASLWPVDDGATLALMSRFYQHRVAGQDVFMALASAQSDLVVAGGPYAEPEAWAAFLAFGRP